MQPSIALERYFRNDVQLAVQNMFLKLVALILAITTATVERTFSDTKMVKTRLSSRLGEDTLDYALRTCIEGQDTLDDEKLKCIISHWKQQQNVTLFCNFEKCYTHLLT